MKGYHFFIGLIIAFALYSAGRYLYFKPKYVKGEVAPAISAQLLNGEEFSLDDLRGYYVLLDFWGSWCGPCRVENPGLVSFRDEFHDQSFRDAEGFEVVNVAIETNASRWKAAIQKDGLDWKYHIGEFERFQSPIAQAYGIKEVPTKFLINPDGYIIGVNMGFDEMRKLLNDRRE